ncbi:MAG: efflux RND transporter periplasmic adaptor subunit [Gemmatimonadetes bacterium]|nr:efflux RND transporter periplasmic adaptor subunit [Gemmatimonadota bacterium]MBM4190846.1 efflux RND transporter periplasmic adaptor subunit [Gemmatimonadota bacterium]
MTQPTPPHADLARLRIDRDAPPPAVQGAVIRNLVLLLVVVSAIAIGWWYLREKAVPQVEVATVGAPAVAGAGAASGVTSVTANGYVVARTKASVSAKAAGRLDYLGVSEGSFVERGTVIARLDNAEFQAGIAQATANLAATEATLIEATADRDQSVREAVRQRDVRAQNPNLVSPQELDAVNSRASQSEARVNAAAARKRAAEAGLELALASNENTIIRAPFTGTVLRKDAEVGEVVAPSVGGGLTRGAVVTMADLSTLEVEVDVNEAYIARITKGLRARITLDAYPDTSFRGSVRQVVPTADRQRATVQVKVSITDRDARILPEMGAKVDFLQPEVRSADAGRDAARPVVRVPQAAVREDGGKSVVWIVRDGRLVRREIEVGPVSAGFREVRSGLTGGELVVIGGVDSPTEGQRVKNGQ